MPESFEDLILRLRKISKRHEGTKGGEFNALANKLCVAHCQEIEDAKEREMDKWRSM